MSTIINTTISFIVGAGLTYLISKLKFFNKKFKAQDAALINLLRDRLTDIFYRYNDNKSIPDYVYQNFLDMLGAYEDLGGNSYIHTIANKMENWETTKTDI